MEWEIGAECLACVLIVLVLCFSREKFYTQMPQTRLYYACLGFALFSTLLNIATVVLMGVPGLLPRWLCYTLNMLYFTFFPLLEAALTYYMAYLIHGRGPCFTRVAICLGVMLAAALAVVFTNPFTGWLFYLDAAGTYVRGPYNRLLYALLVCSANDAASVIAWDVAGSIPAFVQQMNARAEQLGCTSTRFSCPHGLYDDGNVSTAQDMGKIAIACAQYEIYRQIADTLQYEIPATNLHAARSIRSTNKMLDPENSCYRAYIHGMKTGFTTKAGRCYVTAAQQGDTIYGLVILGSDRKNIYAEAAAILDWAFAGCPQQQAAA